MWNENTTTKTTTHERTRKKKRNKNLSGTKLAFVRLLPIQCRANRFPPVDHTKTNKKRTNGAFDGEWQKLGTRRRRRNRTPTGGTSFHFQFHFPSETLMNIFSHCFICRFADGCVRTRRRRHQPLSDHRTHIFCFVSAIVFSFFTACVCECVCLGECA